MFGFLVLVVPQRLLGSPCSSLQAPVAWLSCAGFSAVAWLPCAGCSAALLGSPCS